MRVPQLVCVLFLLLSLPAPARADFIGSSLFRQGTLDVASFHVVSAQEVCSSTTNAPSSATCSGNLAVGSFLNPGVGTFSGTTIATGSTSGVMTLGSAASIDVSRLNQGAFGGGDTRYFANATSTSTITDTVTIGNAGAITNGFLQLAFLLDGISTVAYDPDTTDGFNPGPAAPANVFSDFTINQAGLKTNLALPQFVAAGLYSFDIPMAFGSGQSVSMQLQTFASANAYISEGYSVLTDYSHTATLSNALILDANHQPLLGATLTSASGYTYGNLPSQPSQPAPVPEPATLSLLGVGLVAGAFKRRRSRSRVTRQ